MKIENIKQNVMMLTCSYQYTINSINYVVTQHRNLFNSMIAQAPTPLTLNRSDLMSLFDIGAGSIKDSIYSLNSVSIRGYVEGNGIIGTFNFSDMNVVDVDYGGTSIIFEYPELHSLQLVPGLNISFLHNNGAVFHIMDTRTRTDRSINYINAMFNLNLPISLLDWTDDDLMMLRLAYESNTGEENG